MIWTNLLTTVPIGPVEVYPPAGLHTRDISNDGLPPGEDSHKIASNPARHHKIRTGACQLPELGESQMPARGRGVSNRGVACPETVGR